VQPPAGPTEDDACSAAGEHGLGHEGAIAAAHGARLADHGQQPAARPTSRAARPVMHSLRSRISSPQRLPPAVLRPPTHGRSLVRTRPSPRSVGARRRATCSSRVSGFGHRAAGSASMSWGHSRRHGSYASQPAGPMRVPGTRELARKRRRGRSVDARLSNGSNHAPASFDPAAVVCERRPAGAARNSRSTASGPPRPDGPGTAGSKGAASPPRPLRPPVYDQDAHESAAPAPGALRGGRVL
jgi:hypothetical protein